MKKKGVSSTDEDQAVRSKSAAGRGISVKNNNTIKQLHPLGTIPKLPKLGKHPPVSGTNSCSGQDTERAGVMPDQETRSGRDKISGIIVSGTTQTPPTFTHRGRMPRGRVPGGSTQRGRGHIDNMNIE